MSVTSVSPLQPSTPLEYHPYENEQHSPSCSPPEPLSPSRPHKSKQRRLRKYSNAAKFERVIKDQVKAKKAAEKAAAWEAQLAAARPNQWTHGIFECYRAPATCLVAFICPCHTMGMNAHLGASDSYVGGCSQPLAIACLCTPFLAHPCIGAHVAASRETTANQLGIPIESGPLLAAEAICCQSCILTQEHQELVDWRRQQAELAKQPSRVVMVEQRRKSLAGSIPMAVLPA